MMGHPKMMQLKASDLKKYKDTHVGKSCPICGRAMSTFESKNRVLDHDHTSGQVRDVICRNCNSLEGKIKNLCNRAGKHISKEDFLLSLIAYWKHHLKNPSGILHPNFGKVIKRRRRVK